MGGEADEVTLTAKSWPPFPSHPPRPAFPPQPDAAGAAAAAAEGAAAAAAAMAASVKEAAAANAQGSVAGSEVGLVSFCHGRKFQELGKWATLNHIEYATRHGYDFFKGNEQVLPHMHFLTPFAWLKAGFFWQLLQARSKHEWFVWVDCDALYMNMDKTVPDLIRDLGYDPRRNSDVHIIVADDLGSSIFNTGVLLVKNSEWSRDFFGNVLRMAQNENVRNHGFWEQFAMQELYKANRHMERIHVQIVVDRYKLNAFTVEREFRDGVSFVLHQVNCPGHPNNRASSEKDCTNKMKSFFCAKLASKFPNECT